jgi:hypothetical protein
MGRRNYIIAISLAATVAIAASASASASTWASTSATRGVPTAIAASAPFLSQSRAYRATLASAEEASRLWNVHHADDPIVNTVATCAVSRISRVEFQCLSEAMTEEGVGLDEQWIVTLHGGIVQAKPLGNPFIAGTR